MAASRTNFSSTSCMAGARGVMTSVKAAAARSSGMASSGIFSSGGASSAGCGVKRLRRRATSKSRLTCCRAASCDPVPVPRARKISSWATGPRAVRISGVRGASSHALKSRPGGVPCQDSSSPGSVSRGDKVAAMSLQVPAGCRHQKKPSLEAGIWRAKPQAAHGSSCSAQPGGVVFFPQPAKKRRAPRARGRMKRRDTACFMARLAGSGPWNSRLFAACRGSEGGVFGKAFFDDQAASTRI